jgi:2-polyprenyl-6-methoxyphenol hydroxylase-like FAD-dependent oxidoreductase
MPEPAGDCDVLIVGAGPSGLVLGLFLARRGIRVQIVDKTASPGTTSRALAVQARTLEFYANRPAGTVVEQGRRVLAFNLWVGGRRKARAVLGEIGEGISPFPYALVFPQDEHEQLLVDRLRSLGVEVQRQTALTRFEETDGGVRATLETADGRQSVRSARFIAGCDGAHSQVREGLGIGFPGGTYEHTFYVADIEGSGPSVNGEIHVDFDVADFLAVFPLKQDGHARLVGTVRPDANPGRDLEWEDVSRTAIDHVGLRVSRVNWFSTYRVHHRVANAFRRGRAFLAGDAAHIHSPVGGQGMNTGIGDAVNLAWKLAAVIGGRAGAALVDTYEPERIAYAHRLVATTDQGFTGVTGSGPFARLFRMDVVPAVLPTLFRLPPVRRFFFRTVSQTGIEYRQSGLSAGQAGRVHGGDRLPWVPPAGNGPDNFEPLTSLDWQVHVYGDQPAGLGTACAARRLPLHVFPGQMLPTRRPRTRAAVSRASGRCVGLAAANAQSIPKSLDAYLDPFQSPRLPR